mmetsp:Transcript_10619/g.29974  ORF Transcript_10619/g.29974 Transcript_10619/m.29974 type:complete len:255 (-) Transcript_10619:195-959(-)
MVRFRSRHAIWIHFELIRPVAIHFADNRFRQVHVVGEVQANLFQPRVHERHGLLLARALVRHELLDALAAQRIDVRVPGEGFEVLLRRWDVIDGLLLERVLGGERPRRFGQVATLFRIQSGSEQTSVVEELNHHVGLVVAVRARCEEVLVAALAQLHGGQHRAPHDGNERRDTLLQDGVDVREQCVELLAALGDLRIGLRQGGELWVVCADPSHITPHHQGHQGRCQHKKNKYGRCFGFHGHSLSGTCLPSCTR